MRSSFYALGTAIIIFTVGCGGTTDSEKSSVLVSDAYVVNAIVTSGDIKASEKIENGAGWYEFDSSITQTINVSYGVNDINPVNSKADYGEPYIPLLKAPSNYKNITPFTTMLIDVGDEIMRERYPNAYSYDPTFNFDVVKLSKENFYIAQENAKATLELSSKNTTKNSPKLRIINGTKVSTQDSTWEAIVSLQYYNSHICGGTLIDKEWVLTAAHCLISEDGDRYTDHINVLSGTYSLTIGGIYVEVKGIYAHSDFNFVELDNDIGLIHLKSPITDISPIPLNKYILEDNHMVKVAGWGNTLVDGVNYPDDLMQLDIPIINFNTCNASYQLLTNNMFCAGYMDGSKDSCSGDSGGPLISFRDGEYLLSGIVSFGGTEDQACGVPNFPGVYTKVSNYIDWIESYTGPLNSSSSSSSSSSSEPTLDEIFTKIDEAQDLNELNQIIIYYMGYYNGVYPE